MPYQIKPRPVVDPAWKPFFLQTLRYSQEKAGGYLAPGSWCDMVFKAKKTSTVKVDGADKEHYQTQASLCNVGIKSPAAFFVVPSLAPQDKLANYQAKWDPVLDEWHVTHHPKEFVDSWGTNPKVFGEPRQLHQIYPATPNVVRVEEKSKPQEHDIIETLYNKDEHHTSKYQDVGCTKNVKDNDRRSQLEATKHPLVEREAPIPGVADTDQARQAMTVDTNLAQGSFKLSTSSSPDAEACPTKSTSSSPLLPSPPTTASSISLREKIPTTPSAASSPKQQDSPLTSLSSTPEKKASPPQITVPAATVTSCEPKSQSASAALESTHILPSLSTKCKGRKKGKGKKTKAGENASADKDDRSPQKPPTSFQTVVSLPGTDNLIADSEKTVVNDKKHGDAENIASMDNGTKADVLFNSATAPAPTAVLPVPEKSPSHATPAGCDILVSNPNSSAESLGAPEDSVIEESSLLSPANTKTSPSIFVLHQQANVLTSSLSPPRDKESLPTQLSSNMEKVSSVTVPSTSPMVSEKSSSTIQCPSPATNAGLIPHPKGKGKKKGRAGKKMQAKKAMKAEKDGTASKTYQTKSSKDLKMISAAPEAIETMADTIVRVSHANDLTSVAKTEDVEPSQSGDPITVKASGKDQEIEDAAKVPVQDAIISPVSYNSNRLLAAGPSISSEKIEPAVSKNEHDKESDLKYRDETPDIVVTNTDNKVTNVPSNIDPRPDIDAGEGASDQSHRTLPQGTPLTLGMLRAWVNGGDDEVQAEPLPVKDSAPLTNLGPSEMNAQVDDLPRGDDSTRVEKPVLNADITQSEDIAEVFTGDDSPANVTKNIADSPPMTDTDRNVTTAQDVYNPLCLLSPEETSVVVEKINISSGESKRLEELMPKSENVDKVFSSGNAPVDVVADQPGSAVAANLGLDANTARDDREELKQKDEKNTQVCSNGDSAVAAVEELSDSSSKAALDLDMTVQPFYNPHCLLLPGETSWFIEKVKSSAMGDTNEEELEQNNPDRPSVCQHDDAQQEMDATNFGTQESTRGPESPADQLDNNLCNADIEENSKPHELTLETGMVTGSHTPVDDLPQVATHQKDVEHDIFEHPDEEETSVATPQLLTQQAEPAVPIEASRDPAPEAVPEFQHASSRGLRTQKLAQVAAMVSEVTATLSQSLHANASHTASTDQPANQKASTEPAKETKSSILSPERLVEVATTVPKTREERFLLLELICVLIVRFVGSLFM